MHRLNISYKQFYVTLNEIWLFESDPNAPSTWSERGGKQWQRSIRGRRNWDVELGPCAVIRHLCSVAFVWETKRPQADNSRSLIDRQVSCLTVQKLSTHVYDVTGIMRRPKKRTITCDCRNFIEWYGYTLYHFCIPKDLPAKPMIRIIVWIQYFKLLFKLNEQTAQCIIWHACNLCFISFWKNRGVTVIIRSRIRSNIWMVMLLKHHNDRSGSLILDLTRKSCFIYRTQKKWLNPSIMDIHAYLWRSIIQF